MLLNCPHHFFDLQFRVSQLVIQMIGFFNFGSKVSIHSLKFLREHCNFIFIFGDLAIGIRFIALILSRNGSCFLFVHGGCSRKLALESLVGMNFNLLGFSPDVFVLILEVSDHNLGFSKLLNLPFEFSIKPLNLLYHFIHFSFELFVFSIYLREILFKAGGFLIVGICHVDLCFFQLSAIIFYILPVLIL